MNNPKRDQRPVKNCEVEIVLRFVEPNEAKERAGDTHEHRFTQIVDSNFFVSRSKKSPSGPKKSHDGTREIKDWEIEESLGEQIVERGVGKERMAPNFGERRRIHDAGHVIRQSSHRSERNVLAPNGHQIGEGGVLIGPHPNKMINHRKAKQIGQDACLPKVKTCQCAHGSSGEQEASKHGTQTPALVSRHRDHVEQDHHAYAEKKGGAIVLLA